MSTAIKLYGDHVFSPHFIFIKGVTELDDKSLLDLLGLNLLNRISIDQYSDSEDEILIARIGDWVHIIDNWFYTLWHSKNIKDKLFEIGCKYETFECSIGDSDQSFDFRYFKNGKLVREYIDKDIYGGVTIDFGDKLPSETILFKKYDIELLIIELAKSVGIQMNPDFNQLNVCKIEI